jgi:hypothetical protein
MSLLGSSSFLCFFFSGVADDGEPGGLSSFLNFLFKCKRQWQARQARCHLLHLRKKNKSEKKANKNKGWCTLICHKCTSYFLEEHFLQHHFSNVFYNTALTLLLQHAYATLPSATALQHCFCSIVFCNIAFVLEWWRGLRFLMGRR